MSNKVMHKVSWLGGEFGQFDHYDRAQNQLQRLNFLQTKLRVSETRFYSNFGANFLSFNINVLT